MSTTLYLSKINKDIKDIEDNTYIYQANRKKNVLLPSSLHSIVKTEHSVKKLSNSMEFYNATKYGVDIRDYMGQIHTVI